MWYGFVLRSSDHASYIARFKQEEPMGPLESKALATVEACCAVPPICALLGSWFGSASELCSC